MISTRGRYALRVMIDIAENANENYIPLNDIAKRQEISEKYLESILAVLTKGKLLLGLKGKGGGYKLIKDPKDYTIDEILRLTEGSLAPVACLKEDSVPCKRSEHCKTLPLWQGLYNAIADYLKGISLYNLIANNK